MDAIIDGVPVALETRDNPLPWQRLGLSYTASGYGRRIPTTRMVRMPGETRWRRVYCCIFGNAGTCYVEDRRTPGPDGRPGWIVVT
jgi:hypothetical protein